MCSFNEQETFHALATNIQVKVKLEVVLFPPNCTGSKKRQFPIMREGKATFQKRGFPAPAMTTTETNNMIKKFYLDGEAYQRGADISTRERFALSVDPRFTPKNWLRQRSPFRHFRNIYELLNMRLVRRTFPSLAAITASAVLVTAHNSGLCFTAVEALQASGYLSPAITYDSTPIGIAPEPYILTSGLLTVGLVFRTNQSLERYNKGRDCWAGSLARIRTLIRMSHNWMTASFPKDEAGVPAERKTVITEASCEERGRLDYANGERFGLCEDTPTKYQHWRSSNADEHQLARLLMLYPWALRAHINVRSLVSWQSSAVQDVLEVLPQAEELLDQDQYARFREYVKQCELNPPDGELAHNAWPTCTTINLPLAITHQIGSTLVYRYRRCRSLASPPPKLTDATAFYLCVCVFVCVLCVCFCTSTWLLHREELHMVQLLQLDEQVRGLMEYAVQAEKLTDTAIPTAYTRHISRFLKVWLSCLPLVIWPGVGLATPVVSFVCGYFILGFEDVATQMENPFYVLPQVEYCMQSNNTCHSVLKLALADTVVKQQQAGLV